MKSRGFVEICIYEVKAGREEEFEELMKKVGALRRKEKGYIQHTLFKRTHIQGSFQEVKKGEASKELSKKLKNRPATYILYWRCIDKTSHAEATKHILQTHYKRFPRLLQSIPKIFLCTEIDT